MFTKIGELLYPRRITVLIFIVFLFAMPILHINSEPERTNNLSGEKQNCVIKTEVKESVIIEYFTHTDGNIDVLLGIIERDYVSNYVGALLVVINYVLACGIDRILNSDKM